MTLGGDLDATRWASDVLQSVQPELERFDLRNESLGDLSTLQERLHDEVIASRGGSYPGSGLSAPGRANRDTKTSTLDKAVVVGITRRRDHSSALKIADPSQGP